MSALQSAVDPRSSMRCRSQRWLLGTSAVLVLVFCAMTIVGIRMAHRQAVYAAATRLVPVDLDRYARENAQLTATTAHRVVFFGDSRAAVWIPLPVLPDTEVLVR